MSASCYLCQQSHQAIPGQTPGDALGTCGICSILICAAHGHRDPHLPRYTCVICDSSVLAASAVLTSDTDTHSANFAVVQLMSAALLTEASAFTTLDQFTQGREDFRWIYDALDDILSRAPEAFTSEFSSRFWNSLSSDGSYLLAAAIAIILRYRVRTEDLVLILQIIMREWRDRYGDEL